MSNKNALTLVELIVVVSLMAIILGALIALYTTHHQFYNIASIFTELRGYTKNFKNQISKDIEEAVSVVTSQSLSGTTYTTGSNELVLKCYSLYSTGFETDYYDYIAYRKVGANIKRVVEANATYDDRGDSDRIFIENANSMSFEFYNSSQTKITSNYPTTTRIDIDLDVEKTWAGTTRGETIHSSVRLRNKR
ncbi:MAG: prepilin-type N-terminal cleavage/methylation domain-containing protein [Candidatus Omnitrophica bacterium]|nr:prepilin-type N-terminal cleavage/methylation domain-containing protein [Candidatus Omnitrophota bacterium]